MVFIIRHVKIGKTEKQILEEDIRTDTLTKQKLLVLGHITKDKMISIIDQNSQNPASSKGLRSKIKLYPFLKGGWGLGKISELPKHWAVQNYGHSGYSIHVKNANYLRFKNKEGKIIYRKSVNNHPVRPMNFVEKTVMFLLSELTRFKVGKTI